MDRDEWSDDRLAEEIGAGSEQAFWILVRGHQARIRAYLGACVSSPASVDDLAQDVFIAAYKSIHTYRRDSSLGDWLIGIARHRALRHLRDEARRRAREGTSVADLLAELRAVDLEQSSEDARSFDLRVAALRQCLESLPPDGSRMVTGFYFERRSIREIARNLRRSEGALKVALLRVRDALRRCIEGRLASDGGSR
jgi:RNA polymerase sigma-70 factor (ECF subfamily)